MRVLFWFNFTLRHSDIHQQQKKQKPGQHHHHHHLGRRSSRRSSSVSVGLCAVPHDEESKLRSEASPRVSGRFALKHAPVLLRAAGKKFQPLREKRKKERTKNKTPSAKRSREINPPSLRFFSPLRSHTKQVWQFMEQEAAASPSVSGDVALKAASARFSSESFTCSLYRCGSMSPWWQIHAPVSPPETPHTHTHKKKPLKVLSSPLRWVPLLSLGRTSHACKRRSVCVCVCVRVCVMCVCVRSSVCTAPRAPLPGLNRGKEPSLRATCSFSQSKCACKVAALHQNLARTAARNGWRLSHTWLMEAPGFTEHDGHGSLCICEDPRGLGIQVFSQCVSFLYCALMEGKKKKNISETIWAQTKTCKVMHSLK